MARRKRDYNYFNEFVQLADYSCQAAELLHQSMAGFSAADIEAEMVKMHEIEHSADLYMHGIMNRLMKEFITPIEREDIISIVQQIDDVTDTIEDVIMRLYMYNIQSIRPEVLEFTELIVRCCDALKIAIEDFHNFRKSKTVKENIIEVNHLEDIGDKLYTLAVRNLHISSTDALEIMNWTEIFYRLEKCFDECEDVANLLESIIMKNT